MKARLPQQRGYMVRDGADAPPHHEDGPPAASTSKRSHAFNPHPEEPR